MSIAEKYSKEIEAIYVKYPADHKRSAVMPLLYLAQRDEGYITGNRWWRSRPCWTST